jgi:3-dehydroquinate synthase
MQYAVTFPTGTVEYRLEGSLRQLPELAPPSRSILITDTHIRDTYGHLLEQYRILTIPPGEAHKTWDTIKTLAEQLIQMEAHRKTMLVGIGGGVITDITGFLASIYMRGVPFGFVPTTLLAMVDAAIGGKNGVNLGLHKNMLGTFTQPQFILYDTSLLRSLDDVQWSNGFGEIIKYGCICDIRIINTLKEGDIVYFQRRPDRLADLIAGCVHVKNKIVAADEKESGIRKILNFGHTAGHAFETLYDIPHGHSVALGMQFACALSQQVCGLDERVLPDLRNLMQRYLLPTSLRFDISQVMHILQMDKKRDKDTVDFVLLERLGKACIRPLPFSTVAQGLEQFLATTAAAVS